MTHYDYGFRIYNPGIARFLSVDPLTKSYPMLTPYQFASNTPIMASDMDGLEARIDIMMRHEDEAFLKGKMTWEEVKANRDARAVGALMGIGIVVTGGAIIEYAPAVVPYLYNPAVIQAGNEATAFTWGMVTDEEYPLPAVSDNASMGVRNFVKRTGFTENLENLITRTEKFTNQINWHHIIPSNLRPGRSQAHGVVEAALEAGFKIDDELTKAGLGNIVPIEAFRKSNGLGTHNGSHAHYRQNIIDKLNEFDEIWDGEGASAKEFLEGLIKDVVKKIDENPTTKLDDLEL